MFDAQGVLTALRCQKRELQQTVFHRSRLAKYRSELVNLRKAGASYPELSTWLRKAKRVKVAHTSIMRYLKKLPEVKDYAVI